MYKMISDSTVIQWDVLFMHQMIPNSIVIQWDVLFTGLFDLNNLI